MAEETSAGNEFMVQLSTLASFLRSDQDAASVVQALQSHLQGAQQVAIQNEDGTISVVEALQSHLQGGQQIEVHTAEDGSVSLIHSAQQVGSSDGGFLGSEKYRTMGRRDAADISHIEEGEVVEESQVGMRDDMETQTTYIDTMDGSEMDGMTSDGFASPRMNEVGTQFMAAGMSNYAASRSSLPFGVASLGSPMEKVPCDECGKSFRRMSYLIMHKKAVHSNVKPYTCSVCEQSFTSSWGLKMHGTVHSDARPFSCQLCEAKFKRNYELTKHMAFHVKERSFVCNICGKTFNIERSLKKHMFTHMKDSLPFLCEYDGCGQRFHSMPRMREHYTIVHVGERNHSCPICLKTFKRMSDVRTHMKCVHGDKPHVCDICNRSFATEGMLQRHVQAHADSKEFVCETCNKCFREKKLLGAHLRTHHLPYSCTRCSLSFASEDKLSEHYSNHPAVREKKPKGDVSKLLEKFQCPNCPKYFHSQLNLDNHMSRTCRRDIWQCSQCSHDWPVKDMLSSMQLQCEKCSQYFLASEIQGHILEKHSYKPKFICELCETAFRSEESLDEHLQTCSGSEQPTMVENMLVCEYCGTEFKNRRTLDLHEKTHFTVTLTYSCLLCEREFKRKDSLKIHLQSHFTSKKARPKQGPYKCEVCSKEYKKKFFLEKHLKSRSCATSNDDKSTTLDAVAKDSASSDHEDPRHIEAIVVAEHEADRSDATAMDDDDDDTASLHIVDNADDAAKKVALLGNNVVVIKVEELDLGDFGLAKRQSRSRSRDMLERKVGVNKHLGLVPGGTEVINAGVITPAGEASVSETCGTEPDHVNPSSSSSLLASGPVLNRSNASLSQGSFEGPLPPIVLGESEMGGKIDARHDDVIPGSVIADGQSGSGDFQVEIGTLGSHTGVFVNGQAIQVDQHTNDVIAAILSQYALPGNRFASNLSH